MQTWSKGTSYQYGAVPAFSEVPQLAVVTIGMLGLTPTAGLVELAGLTMQRLDSEKTTFAAGAGFAPSVAMSLARQP